MESYGPEELVWRKAISKSRPTPYILTNIHTVKRAAQKLQSLLPGVELYYAIKSNNDARILSLLASEIKGFDIASFGELELIIPLRISPARILFSNPVKMPDHIARAYAYGVKQYAADTYDELEKLSKYAPGSNVHIRIQVPSGGSAFPLSSKFGMSEDAVVNFARKARELGLIINGVTFHVGSQAGQPKTWERAIALALKCIKVLQQEGFTIDLLDLGGGFPADYQEGDSTILEEVARRIMTSVQAIPSNVRVVAEPGRCLVAKSSVIVSSVIAKTQRKDQTWLYLDMGTFQGLMEPLEVKDWHYNVFNIDTTSGPLSEFVLTGPTCDPCDTIGKHYQLPSNSSMGDQICIMGTGAYTAVYGSNFNGFEVPKTYFIEE